MYHSYYQELLGCSCLALNKIFVWQYNRLPSVAFVLWLKLFVFKNLENVLHNLFADVNLKHGKTEINVLHKVKNVFYCLQKVVKTMKLSWTPLLSNLSIYRWANQAMVTDVDHPMLPLIWQRFFSLYLQRPVTQPG